MMRALRALVTHDDSEVSNNSSTTATSHATVRLHRHHHHQKRRNSGATAVIEALDTTMKNAIESLAQDDAESALVFALVHDSEFRLATAIASVRRLL